VFVWSVPRPLTAAERAWLLFAPVPLDALGPTLPADATMSPEPSSSGVPAFRNSVSTTSTLSTKGNSRVLPEPFFRSSQVAPVPSSPEGRFTPWKAAEVDWPTSPQAAAPAAAVVAPPRQSQQRVASSEGASPRQSQQRVASSEGAPARPTPKQGTSRWKSTSVVRDE
jgi:hypothetical protein